MYNDDDFNEEEQENSNQGQSQNKLLEFYEANKKLVWLLGGVIIFILVFSVILGGGGNNTETPSTGVSMFIDSLSERITVNSSKRLLAVVEGNQNATFNWSSSDPSIATVDSNGIVTGVKLGAVIITATYVHTDGDTHTASCEIIVSEGDPDKPVTNVSFPDGELMMSVGSQYELRPTIEPTDGYITNVKYTSYNKSVVEVDENGLVKALKVGKATIVLEVNNQFETEINVNVIEEDVFSQIVVNPTTISFIDRILPVEVNEVVDIEYEYEPFNVSIASLKWESSDETIATVENGRVRGIKEGTAEITVTALNGKYAIMTVNVTPEYIPVSSIEILNEKSVTLSVGGTHTIVKNILPGDATNKNVTFQSSNTSVATVDDEGQVRAVSAGSATITVTTEDGNKKETVSITVQGSSSGSSGGSSSGSSGSSGSTSSIGTLKYRDKNGNAAYTTIEKAKAVNDGNGHVLPITVSVNKEPVDRITLCVKKCATDDTCPDTSCDEKDFELGGEIEFTEGNGLYVIRATKYTDDGKYGKTDPNYVYIKSGATEGGSTTENSGSGSSGSGETGTDSGSQGGSTENPVNTLSASWDYIGERFNIFALGTVYVGFVNINSSVKEIKNVYYCLSEGNCMSLNALKNGASTSNALLGAYCGDSYSGIVGTTYKIKKEYLQKSLQIQFCMPPDETLVLTIKYSDGTYERVEVNPTAN